MNEEQMKIIDNEVDRLFRLKFEYSEEESKIYINGRIDGLKWVKENI